MKLGFAAGHGDDQRRERRDAGRAVEEIDAEYRRRAASRSASTLAIYWTCCSRSTATKVALRDGERGGTDGGARPRRRQHALRADAHAGMNAATTGPGAGVQSTHPARALAVRRLELRDFRNYRQLALGLAPRPVVLRRRERRRQDQPARGRLAAEPRAAGCGRAKLAELDRERRRPLASARPRVDCPLGLVDLATAHDPSTAERRRGRVDGAAAAQPERAWRACVSLLWLTPAMDRLFAEGASGAAPLPRPAGAGARPGPRRAGSRPSSGRCASARTCCAPGRARSGLARGAGAAHGRGRRWRWRPPAASWCATSNGWRWAQVSDLSRARG